MSEPTIDRRVGILHEKLVPPGPAYLFECETEAAVSEEKLTLLQILS